MSLLIMAEVALCKILNVPKKNKISNSSFMQMSSNALPAYTAHHPPLHKYHA